MIAVMIPDFLAEITGTQSAFGQQFSHHQTCCGTEHDPCRKIAFEDRIHPVVNIAHAVFEIEYFTQDQKDQSDTGKNILMTVIFAPDKIHERDTGNRCRNVAGE